MPWLPAASDRKEIFKIAIPVSLESVFQFALGFVNQVIVGMLGTATIAAVGLSNNLMFIGILCLNTLGSGAAILASRAKGRSDDTAFAHIASFSVAFAFVVSLLFALPVFFSADGFLQMVGASSEIAQIGAPFLSLIALTLPFITISVVCSSILRSQGLPRLPMVITMTSMALTPLLSWLMVVRWDWGAEGAAWANIITQASRAVALLWALFASRWGLPFSLDSWIEIQTLLRDMVPLVWPLFVTELLFSSGSFLFALLVERIGTEQLAVYQITHTLEGVFIMLAVGFNSASTILVSQAIGRSDTKSIWEMSRGIWHLMLLVSVIAGSLFALMGFALPMFYPNTSAQVHQWGLWAIVLNALFLPIRNSNMIFFGTLAAGGDTRFLLLSDIITVFFVGLPLAYILAFPLGLGLWGVFLGRALGEEVVRISMFLWRYRSGKWFRISDEPQQF
jgi:putative MATE family efflux protein